MNYCHPLPEVDLNGVVEQIDAGVSSIENGFVEVELGSLPENSHENILAPIDGENIFFFHKHFEGFKLYNKRRPALLGEI